jgi:hypothetical protein
MLTKSGLSVSTMVMSFFLSRDNTRHAEQKLTANQLNHTINP